MNCKICMEPTNFILNFENSVKTQAVSTTREESVAVPHANIELFHCNTCDFYQIKNIDFKHYEDEEYYLTTQISKTQRDYQERLLKEFADYISSPIAEIGPGDGYLGSLLQSDYEYTGYEPAKKSYDECKRKSLNVVNEYFSKIPGKYKTIISRQVLEHIDDLNVFIGDVYSSLTDDGVAIFEVPNIDKARKLNRLVDFCPEHLNYFTLSSLSLLISSHGFSVEQISKTYDSEYLLVVAAKKLEFSLPTTTIDFKSMVFWGAGSRGISLCNIFNAEPDYFVDSDANKWGKYVPSTGIEIKSPDFFFSDGSCTSVVITTFFYYQEVLCELRQQGFNGTIYRIDERNELVKCSEKTD